MSASPVTLEDKYKLASGRIYLTGTQALVRLAMIQRERDLAAGLNTAALTGTLVLGNTDRTATASGTSMASPHIAGIAALMLQRRPTLTPDQIKGALQVTATKASLAADRSIPTSERTKRPRPSCRGSRAATTTRTSARA
jgi:hypothetical protein